MGRENMDAEVGVIGIGTMGSMAMWQLARRGVSVLGFEQFGIGHDYSAAGGESRVFRTAYGEGAEYVPLLKAAYRQWRELERETKQNLLHLNGGLMIGSPRSAFMKNVLKSARSFNLDHATLSREEAKIHYPQHRLLPGEMMVLDREAGYIRPELAVVSAAKRAEQLGAKIHKFSRVESIEPQKNRVKIRANGIDYTVGQVLIASGPWTGAMVPGLKQQLSIRRLVMTWYTAKNLSEFKPDQFPVFIRESKEEKFYGAPSVDGSMVKVAVYMNYGILEDADQLSRTVNTQDLSRVRNVVSEFLPGLYPDPVRVGVYMDLFTTDEHSIVGKLPGHDNIILLSGFSGHGFKLAPAIGEIAADIVMGLRNEYSINHLSPKRFSPESNQFF